MMDGAELAYPVKYLFGEEFYIVGGLTKRELFAARAMQGILPDPMAVGEFEHIARLAVLHADALIAELSKEVQGE